MTTTAVDHYADRYWNDLPAVDRHLRLRSTGNPDLWWMDDLKTRYATPPRRRALIVGCGNGWAERFLADRRAAEHYDAFDGSAEYLRTAEAERGDRPISYALFDFNDWTPQRSYDLIVNVAALHHVRYLFRMAKLLAAALEPDGIFVHWEYVGPSRNQYSARHVALMQAVNDALPERFRTRHPLLRSVTEHIAGDPTEAIHSADIVRALDQHFEPLEVKMLGGGLAYQLLWNNTAEFEKDDPEAAATLDWLLRLDAALTDRGLIPSLFAFMVYGKRTRRTTPRAAFDRLVREPARERFADLAGGYYPRQLLQARRALRGRPRGAAS